MNTHDNTSTKPVKPGSYIVALLAIGLIIGATVIQGQAKPDGATDIKLPPITAADHSRGNIDAPVKVIEYSDLECPFCKDFHQTMLKVFQEYGPTGDIQWVYRHFPLTQLHAKATDEAIATECVAKLAGNDAFWLMTDKIFETTGSNDKLDLSTLPALALASGVKDIKAFNTCYTTKETSAEVASQVAGGVEAGAQGTPYTIVVSPKGNKFVISGAYPLDQVKEMIEKAKKDR